MNIQVNNTSPQVMELNIEVTPADYTENVEKALKQERRKAQIPGFRPGNAPMGMIKKMYEKHLIAEEVNQLVDKALYIYIKEHEINIIGDPLPLNEKTIIDLDKKDVPFLFVFEMALQPTFELNFEQLPPVQYLKKKITELDINHHIDELRKRHGDYITPEKIGIEDFISLKYDETESFCFISDFNETGKLKFIGKKINDEVTCNLSEIFISPTKLASFLKIKETELLQEPYTKNLTISHITHITLPELDDAFFKKLTPDGSITNETELRQKVALDIESQWKVETDRLFVHKSIQHLIENIQIDLPDDFIKRLILSSQKEITPEALEKDYEEYKKSLKWQIIENKIIKDNNIQVSKEEITQYVRNFFIQHYFSNLNPKEIEEELNGLVVETLKKQEEVKNIQNELYDQKIKDFLLSNMNITYEERTFEKGEDVKEAKKEKKVKEIKEEKETQEEETQETKEVKEEKKESKSKSSKAKSTKKE